MYNIDQNVYLKGTIVGISKTKDGIVYEVQVEDEYWHERTITTKAENVKLAAITMDELERACQE